MHHDPAFEADLLDRFQTLMQHVADLHAHEFVGVDLTMSQAKVLYLVTVRPGTPLSSLATELGVGLSAMSGLVDRLVVAGYVERHEDPRDRRQQLVTATPTGAQALDRMRELRAELMRRLIHGLRPDEQAALGVVLDGLSREIQRLGQPGAAASLHERTSP